MAERLGGAVPQWTLGDRLRKARTHAGLEQIELANQIGIGRSTVVTYENNQSVPRRPVLVSWALATGVSLEWLCEGTTLGKAKPQVNKGFKSTLNETSTIAA